MKKACGSCGQPFEAKRRTAKFCSDRCRMRSSRSPKAAVEAEAPPVDQAESAGALTEAVEGELAAAGRSESAVGRAVLALARRIDAGDRESGASLASLVKEFRASMADATKGVKEAADPVDELRARRERKHTG